MTEVLWGYRPSCHLTTAIFLRSENLPYFAPGAGGGVSTLGVYIVIKQAND
mgnify:FL=1